MRLLRVKYFGVDLGFEEAGDDGTRIKPLYIEIIADVENEGEISELRKRYRLADLDFRDFMTAEDLEATISGITTDTTPAQMAKAFAGMILKVIASETGYSIAGEDYVAPPTLRQETNEVKGEVVSLQQAIAELSMIVAAPTV